MRIKDFTKGSTGAEKWIDVQFQIQKAPIAVSADADDIFAIFCLDLPNNPHEVAASGWNGAMDKKRPVLESILNSMIDVEPCVCAESSDGRIYMTSAEGEFAEASESQATEIHEAGLRAASIIADISIHPYSRDFTFTSFITAIAYRGGNGVYRGVGIQYAAHDVQSKVRKLLALLAKR